MMPTAEISIINFIADTSIYTKTCTTYDAKTNISENIEFSHAEFESKTGIRSKVEAYSDRTFFCSPTVDAAMAGTVAKIAITRSTSTFFFIISS